LFYLRLEKENTMINIEKILKRSWLILWNYRILWVFGFLLALTTGGGGGSSGSSRSQTTQNNPGGFSGVLPENTPEWIRELSGWFVKNVEPLFTHPEQHIGTFLTIGLIIFLIVLVFSLLTALVRYPTETAVIRMVNEYENSGSKVGFRQGWKLGWTRLAFRLWLIDLVLSIPALVFMLLIVATGLIIAFSVSSAFKLVSVIGVVAAIGIGFLSIFILVVVAVFLGVLRNFFVRAAALDGKGVVESLQSGWAMFKRNWKSAGVMWLVMVGIGIGYGIFGIVVFFLLIPAYLVLLLPAAFVAALPALIGFGFTSLFASGPLAWIIAALFAAPFFFITLFAPLILINGWYKIYESNIWTLTYREIKALESLATRDLPVIAPTADIPPAA
jgi:hypothetical protein